MNRKALAFIAGLALTGSASSGPNHSLTGALVIVFQELVRLAPDLGLPVRLSYAESEVQAEVRRAVQAVSARPVSACGPAPCAGTDERALVLYVSAASNPSPGVSVFPAAYGCGILCGARYEYTMHLQGGNHWRLAQGRLLAIY